MTVFTEPKTGTSSPSGPEGASGRQWPLTGLVGLLGFIFVPSIMTVAGVSFTDVGNLFSPDAPTTPSDISEVAEPGSETLDLNLEAAGDGLAFDAGETSPLTSLNDWVEERVPGRELAFEFERTTTRIIDDNYTGAVGSNERVQLGEDGWLFITDATNTACVSAEREAQWAAEIDRVTALVEGAGKQAIIAIAPDRAIMAPELLGTIDNTCPLQNRAVIQRLAEKPQVIDLGTAVQGEAHALQLDTHWSPTGAAAGMQLVVDEIQLDVWDSDKLVSESVDRPGDLDGLVGYANTETVNLLTVESGLVTDLVAAETSLPGRPVEKATTLGAAEANVLMIHDSFGGYFAASDPTHYQTGSGIHYLRPWFSSVDNVRLAGDNAQSLADPAVVEALDEADVVVLLFVQRRLDFRFAPGLLSDPLTTALG